MGHHSLFTQIMVLEYSLSLINSAIFSNFFFTTGEPDKIQKIHNHLEKEGVLSFL